MKSEVEDSPVRFGREADRLQILSRLERDGAAQNDQHDGLAILGRGDAPAHLGHEEGGVALPVPERLRYIDRAGRRLGDGGLYSRPVQIARNVLLKRDAPPRKIEQGNVHGGIADIRLRDRLSTRESRTPYSDPEPGVSPQPARTVSGLR